jgi:SAM-dependent methyltransferase
MFTKEYWDNRVVKYGHTGHSEPFLYCFDQEARKFAVAEIIRSLQFSNKERLLDFGCGSGEFLELLKYDFKELTGFDISERVLEKARKKNILSHLVLTNSDEKVKQRSPFDLILTATVLQGLEKGELKYVIKKFSELLAENGYILCMEFFSHDGTNFLKGENRATMSDWKEILQENKLGIVDQYSFYNPVLFPTTSWRKYKSEIILKIIKPLKYLAPVKSYFSKRAKQIIYEEKDVLGIENSIFKIYILQKDKHANKTT